MQFTFEVKAPIFVLRQWHRHRTWSYNELSARYRGLPDEFYVPDPRCIGSQSTDNKQGRIIDRTSADDETVAVIDEQCRQAFAAYRALIARNVPREVARLVLPLATYSHMFASVNLLNLLRFLTLRDHPHAQYEIQLYAKALRESARPIVPVCIETFERHRWEVRDEQGHEHQEK